MGLRIWLAALSIYIMAIAGRTSFGVASLDALDRFDLSAAELSIFTVVQLGVYAAAQVPCGIILDKVGSRPMLIGGAVIIGLGQIGLGFADSYGWALAARFLVGLGDATAFNAVIRLIPQWFEPKRIPLFTTLTGLLGQIGQVISSLPFAYALAHFGWEGAFVGLGVVGAVIGLAASPLIWEKQAIRRDREKLPMSVAAKHPGTWLGFWTHFLLAYSPNMFILLWGVPFMVANGIPMGTASALLIVSTVAGVVVGPPFATFLARHPLRRSWLVLTILAALSVSWAYVLLVDRPIRVWEFVVLLIVLACANAGSNAGFDFARTSVPLGRLGTANGFVNQGGFVAALASAFMIGLILDWVAPDGDYTRNDFRIAMASQFLIIAVGLAGFLVSRAYTRRWMKREGTVVPPVREVIERIRRERRETEPPTESGPRTPGRAGTAGGPRARGWARGGRRRRQ